MLLSCYRAFFPSISPTLLKCNWCKTLCKFQVCNVLIQCDTVSHWYCNVITTMAWANTSIMSHNCRFFFPVMRTFKIYCLSNFQVCGTVLPSINTRQYMRSPEVIHLLRRNLHFWPMSLHFSHPPASSSHHSILFSWVQHFYIPHIS